jgi:hypothetical protein
MLISFKPRTLARLFALIMILVISAAATRPASAYGDDWLDGEYTVNGTRPDGTPYTGSLSITSVGSDSFDNDTYELTWTIGQAEIDGLAIYHDDILSAAFGAEDCGLITYSLHSDGKFAGTWSDIGSEEFGIEMATVANGATLGGIAGQYSASGVSGEGEPYNSQLSIQGHGMVYSLIWTEESEAPEHGIGLLEYQGLSAVYGNEDNSCGIISYTVTDNYELIGVWANTADGKLGSEVASPADTENEVEFSE